MVRGGDGEDLGLRVVVVDDELTIAEALARYLRACGWTVQVFHDPTEALTSVLDDPPFALLTDLSMPGLDGATLVRRVRRRLGDRAPKVVFISANEPVGEDRRLADALCRKPFRISRLEQKLRAWADDAARDPTKSSGTRLRPDAIRRLREDDADTGS